MDSGLSYKKQIFKSIRILTSIYCFMFRVPSHMKGPLDTFWKIRDKDGYILNSDGSKSACVHQWDRWHSELVNFIDQKLY
jgi:hypothetical protein